MRPLIDLLADLRAKGVTLSLEGESLKVAAPPGVLTPALKSELRDQKPALLTFLRASEASRPNHSLFPQIDRTSPLPLSYGQQRLWFLEQLDQESTVYNIGMGLELSGPLNVAALERSFQEVIQRHETLRTCFLRVNGIPQTKICEQVKWSLNIIDARHLSAHDARPQLVRLASSLVQQHLDLTHAPLFRAHLLELGAEHNILVFVLHHIIFDGWSIGILGREVSELYRAYSSNSKPELPQLLWQYVDYASWQRKWLEAGELDRQLSYWKTQLSGAPPVTSFPADGRRPQSDLFRGSRSRLTVPRELTASLEAMSQRHTVTLFMVLLAAFKVLLSRYTSQEDIVVGSPSAGRTRTELYQMMGFFVNNLVLRTDLSGDPSFSEALARVRAVTRGAYDHQDVPFDQLVHALRPERAPDHSPLFQTMFIFQNFPLEPLQLAGMEAKQIDLDVDTARYDLTIEAFPRDGELHIYFDYNNDLYEEATITRLQKHYLAVLSAVASDAEQKISEIPLLSSSEREDVLFTRNNTEREIPPELCFHQQFEKIALQSPDRIALNAGNVAITYGELNTSANRIAAMLRTRGAKPESLVAIFLERGIELVTAILGVAKAGAAYVPLDPAYPQRRIDDIVQDAQPVSIITNSNLLHLLPASANNTLCLDAAEAVQQDRHHSVEPVSQNNLAYVIFTSGSTGRPKGVQITHRSLLNFLNSMQRTPGFSENDVLLAVTTVSFDIAALELLLPIYSGATVCICLEPNHPEVLLRDLDRYRPTVMQATPATWKLLIAAGWHGDDHLRILCGGEALEPALARSLLERSESVWNMYGPTETTIWSAVLCIESAHEDMIPIGRPIDNTTFFVLDRSRRPVPVGVPGELWIGGEGVARGYFNRSDLTAERFFPCPWSSDPEARMYRTGDLVRYRRDGNLDFYGRLDDQVKLRGFRIELGEIETTLRTCPGILDALTLLREDNGEKKLVAYLKYRGEEPPSQFAVQDHVRERLPEYMVPAAYVFLNEFPRLPNGKLDRSSFPEPAVSVNSNECRGPVTNVELLMCEIWREVLALEKVGVLDNFFELGGHSLSAVRLISRIRSAMDMDLPLRCIFVHPTIASLSQHISYDATLHRYCYTNELPKWSCLVPVQPRGSRIPFFFIAGYQNPDETLLEMSQLIPHLGMEQPLFGFRPRWIEGDASYATVEEMAQEFLAEIRAVRPKGPYMLGGHCVGGIAALEIAQLLIKEGEEVILMTLLDTERPTRWRRLRTDLYFIQRRAKHITGVLAGIVLASRSERRAMVSRLIHRKLKGPDQFYESKVGYRRMLYSHSPEHYPGRITLIVNEEQALIDKDLGWTGAAGGGIEIHVVPGNHHNVMHDHAREVAQVISKSIARVYDPATAERVADERAAEMTSASV